MGLVNQALKRYTVLGGGSLENPSNWVLRTFGANGNTASGIDVNERTGLLNLDILTCVRIISETIAQLPLVTYKQLGDGVRKRATNHPLYSVLQERANEEMTAFTFKETMQAHLLSWGNAYAWIERNEIGDCVGLWPLLPDRTYPVRSQGSLYYHTTVKKLPTPGDPGIRRVFPARDVFHLPGLGFDGLVGYSVIQMIRESIGLSQAQEEYAGRFYSNGGTPPTALTYAKQLSEDDIKRIKAEWDDGHKGTSNAWKIALLDQGMDIKTIGIPQQDQQFIESRKFSSQKIAGFFRVPANMLGASEAAGPYGVGKEQDQINFRIFTIMPWAVRWEHAISMKLLLRPRDAGYYVKFLMDGLERGDFKSRMDGYAIGFGKWLTTDEIRGLEEMNPYEAPEDPDDVGKILLWPLNMAPAEKVAQKSLDEPAPPSSPPDDAPPPPAAAFRRALFAAQRGALLDAADRIIRRETTDLLARSKKKTGDWLNVFYEDHRDYIKKQIGPLMRSYAETIGAEVSREIGRDVVVPAAFVGKYIDGYASRHVDASMDDVRAMDPLDLSGWVHRPGWIATREASQAGNAFAHAAYKAAGVPFVVWQTGDDCRDCQGLHDKKVVPDQPFARRQDVIDPKYVPQNGLGHPPHCEGCECVIVADRSGIAPRGAEPLHERPAPAPNVNVTIAEGAIRAGDTTVHVPPTVIAEGAVQVHETVNVPERSVDVHNTVEGPTVNVPERTTTVNSPVTVTPAAVTIEKDAINVNLPPEGDKETTVHYDKDGKLQKTVTRKVR